MKRFFVLLIGLACAAAQAQQAPCLKLHSAKLKDHVLRQGSTAVMELVFRSTGCYVFNGSPSNRVWPALRNSMNPRRLSGYCVRRRYVSTWICKRLATWG